MSKINYFSLIFYLTMLFTFSNCGNKKSDSVTPVSSGNSVIPGAPERFGNPEGYMTVEVDGKSLEFGLSTASSQLYAMGTGGIYGYNIYASLSSNDGVKSITLNLSTQSKITDINVLKGVHKSSDIIDGYSKTTRILYSDYSSATRQDKRSTIDQGCTVEITSTTSPWIEGTFSVENTTTGSTAPTIRKGVFKVKYK